MNTQNQNTSTAARRAVEPVFDATDGAAETDHFAAPEYFEGLRLKRVLAFLIDFCILVALALVWWPLGTFVSVFTLGAAWPLVGLGAILMPIVYHTYLIGAERNATLGMRALGIRVIVWNGRKPTHAQALMQTLLFYATVPITNGLVLLVSLFNDRGRCLHDILCGTVVVNVLDRPEIVDARR